MTESLQFIDLAVSYSTVREVAWKHGVAATQRE